ncbi:MAG: hypothetical protein OHK0056_25090 [Bacteriovoracaceae bacterium]
MYINSIETLIKYLETHTTQFARRTFINPSFVKGNRAQDFKLVRLLGRNFFFQDDTTMDALKTLLNFLKNTYRPEFDVTPTKNQLKLMPKNMYIENLFIYAKK